MAADSNDDPAAPRASGRVRKRPQTLYDTGAGAPSSKRRRSDGVDDDDEEMIDYHESSGSEDEEGEPDEEELRAQNRARKQPAQRKPRVNGTTTLPIRQARKKRTGKKALNGIDAEGAGGMFAELFAENVESQQLVSQWLQRFDENETDALAELVNFILRAAGCTSTVTAEQIENPDDITSYIADLQDEFQASNPTDYPLMQAKGRTATTVKQGVANVIDMLCKSIAQNGLLFENPALIDSVHNWFSTMSTAANRPFRHTATVVSLLFTTSLCEVARDLANDAAKSQRQAETEQKKASKNKARIADIEKKVADANNRVEAVEEIVKDWYTTVFIHRYKDVDAAIRRECAAALGDWATLLPSIYLDSTHLRYLGWMLSDIHPSVRLECVKQTQRFYKAPDMVNSVRGFTDKFRPRLVEIATQDAEVSVRIAAIDLLDILREHSILSPEDVDAVGRLVFEQDDKVRKAAARFLAAGINELYEIKVNGLGGVEALEEVLTAAEDNYAAPRFEWLKLKCIVEILEAYRIEDELPQHIERPRLGGSLTLVTAASESRSSLAAADLLDRIKEAKEPRMAAGFLLAETPAKNRRKTNDLTARFRKECSLSEREELVMLEVFLVSLRQEVSLLAEKLRSSSSKKLQSEYQESLEDAVRHALTTIPLLLERFGNSAEAVSTLLRSLLALNSSAVRELGIESGAYTALLDQAKRQFTSHTSEDVLTLAVQVVAYTKSFGELEEAASEVLEDLWETSVVEFINNIDLGKVKQRGSASEEELQSMLTSMHRLALLSLISDSRTALEDESAFSQVSNRRSYKATIDCIIDLMERARTTRKTTDKIGKLEDQVAQRAAEIALTFFRWTFLAIEKQVDGPSSTGMGYAELEPIAERRDSFHDNIFAILQQRKAKDEVCMIYAVMLLDLYISQNTLARIQPKPETADDYTILIADLSKTEQKEIMRAFAGAEAVYASLANKKLDTVNVQDEPIVDDFDEDPLSDDEDDVVEESQITQAKLEGKQKATLLAESRLCQIASKIVMAVIVNLMDRKPTRKRLERNKAKLGSNFKEVCKLFDLDNKGARKLKARSEKKATAGNSVKTKATPGRKDNAIDADSEQEDEIEDIDDEVQAQDHELADEVDDMEV